MKARPRYALARACACVIAQLTREYARGVGDVLKAAARKATP